MAQEKATPKCCGDISVDVKPGDDGLTIVIKGEGFKKTEAFKKIVVCCSDDEQEGSE